ncbi:sulfite exporter TauE/SafE family protein [Thiothrix winogradskyi]|uniref:Probable membrane transporter protein n=1 Tax=Thiothrix winogradskyi TaxID=96472 RepID=A0ABY3T444_9GAMM|nr:sulfite exporter TauE/SafE family protein [Thiothrix winogradskyi]UJS26341.1 sulfite exporter TauE/SafE family protein [Thiothrix winogradskyi]
MDWLHVTFPVSGVTTWVFIPPLVAFVLSFFASMGGVSGGFLLLPFQMSVLGYTAPSVSATNQLFNVVAIPSGVWRYVKEQRMVWPLTWAVIIGTLPGVLVGGWVRLEYLPDPRDFKFFIGLVLLYLGVKLLADFAKRRKVAAIAAPPAPAEYGMDYRVSDARFSWDAIGFTFMGQAFNVPFLGVFLLCASVGIIGGIYGIGGGAIIAPFFVAFFRLPVHAIAGAALMGTLVTSVAGVAIFQLLALYYPGVSVAPDWQLGLLFGLGGMAGMYLGARCQKYIPATALKLLLLVCVLALAGKYIVEFMHTV